MVTIFISGFSGTSSGNNPGTHLMADNANMKKAMPGKSYKFTYMDKTKIINQILASLKHNQCEPVVIIGHSLGGGAAHQVAVELGKMGKCVDLLIQIESVDLLRGRRNVPRTVASSWNLYAGTSKWNEPTGDSIIGSTINIEMMGANHTSIDEQSRGAARTTLRNIKGKTTWEIVETLGRDENDDDGCNCPKKLAMTGSLLEKFNRDWKIIAENFTGDEIIHIVPKKGTISKKFYKRIPAKKIYKRKPAKRLS